ncbi:glucosaminidase domain-containing protein [Chryseolinea sp. T2]|uniref:glucosaminidase domain-containing protein n=1 Tax=Chryseolinea sp. T2 TaxID=3129255 RepID=UPI00307887BF
MTAKEYLKRITKFIKGRLKGTSLLPSVVMAHALYEASDDDGYFGKSLLATEYNNDVRVKAGRSWKGPKIKAPLHPEEITPKNRKAWFRIYPSSEHAIKDRIDMLLTSAKGWPRAFLHSHTVRVQAQLLQISVVSNDPRYGERIAHLVDKHKLYLHDGQWLIEKAIVMAATAAMVKLGIYLMGFWDVILH